MGGVLSSLFETDKRKRKAGEGEGRGRVRHGAKRQNVGLIFRRKRPAVFLVRGWLGGRGRAFLAGARTTAKAASADQPLGATRACDFTILLGRVCPPMSCTVIRKLGSSLMFLSETSIAGIHHEWPLYA